MILIVLDYASHFTIPGCPKATPTLNEHPVIIFIIFTRFFTETNVKGIIKYEMPRRDRPYKERHTAVRDRPCKERHTGISLISICFISSSPGKHSSL